MASVYKSHTTRNLKPLAGPAHGLSLATAPRKAQNDQKGSDPYNTSGSFDRKKNWVRVGKR